MKSKSGFPDFLGPEGTPEQNVAAFLEEGRVFAKSLGPEVAWGAVKWSSDPLVPKVEGMPTESCKQNLWFLCSRPARSKPALPLPDCIFEFAQAYVVLTRGLSQGPLLNRIRILRHVGFALREEGAASITSCSHGTLNRAERTLSTKLGQAAMWRHASLLRMLAEMLDAHGFTHAYVGDWMPATRKPSDPERSSPEFQATADKKLPSVEFVRTMFKCFALAKHPEDRIASSIVMCLLAAPKRINEVLRMAEDCRRHREDLGEWFLALSYPGSKGGRERAKWLLPQMRDYVDTALETLLEVTAPARRIKRHYDLQPHRLYLPEGSEHLRGKERLTLKEAAFLLGLPPNEKAHLSVTRMGLKLLPSEGGRRGAAGYRLSFKAVEEYLLGKLPEVMRRAGGPDYHPLLLIEWRRFRFWVGGQGCPCMFDVISKGVVSRALEGTCGRMTMAFRMGLDPEKRIRGNTRSLRHLLYTLALEGGCPREEVDAWTGILASAAAKTYDNVSADGARRIDREMMARTRGRDVFTTINGRPSDAA